MAGMESFLEAADAAGATAEAGKTGGLLAKLRQLLMTGGRVGAGGAALGVPLAMAAVASHYGPPRPQGSDDDGTNAFFRNAASTGGTGLLNTPEENQESARLYFGDRGPQVAPTPASPPPIDEPGDPKVQAEALKWLLAQEGGGGRKVGGVGAEVSPELRKMIDKLQSTRTALGAFDASQKPTTKVFDALKEDAALRAENPDRRPDNTDYWRAQAMPRWVGGTAGFSIPDTSRAAQLMSDIDKRAQDTHEARLAKLLGFKREGVAGENLLANEDYMKRRGTLSSQMPDQIEAHATEALAKDATDRARINSASALANDKRGATDPMRRLVGAYEMLAKGEAAKDPQTIRVANALIKMLNPKDKPEKPNKDIIELGVNTFNSAFKGKENNPVIADARIRLETALQSGGDVGLSVNQAIADAKSKLGVR